MSGQEKGLLYTWACKGMAPAAWLDSEPLPYGAIVAVVDLVDCARVEDVSPGRFDEAFGNYAPGRWAWITRNLRRLAQPIPYRGARGLFEVPDEATTPTCGARGSAEG